WQLDLAADVRDTEESVGGAYTWRMKMSGDDYTRAFAYLFADCGPIIRPNKSNEGRLLRPARGDNRRLPTRNGGSPASCAKEAMAPRPTGTAALILPQVGTHTEDFGYPTRTVDRLVVRRLLQARSYDTLDTVLSAYADSVQRDHRLEYRLFDAYAAFQVAIPALEPLLNEWVRQRPTSAAALIARATFLRAAGWHARGTASAAKTSRVQFQRMDDYFRRARIDLAAALRLAPNSIVAYRQLIDIASTSRGDPEGSRQLLDRALSIQPHSFVLRAAHMHNLLPRWGGSYDAMTEFAEESAPFAKRNPRMRALQGFVDWDRGRDFESQGQDMRAIEAYTRALRFGNYWLFSAERGALYSELKRYPEALEDLNGVLLQYPQYAEAVFKRSWVLYELGRISYPNDVYREYSSQCFLDTEMAAALDPTDESYNDWVDVVRKSIPEFEPPARP
ncbi:MAG TPA: tetratricopeptide repeat protein, partial [Gemmatimonadaceae bacterium]|nr:tetratricopeptide repeat protein [Gemmatimonadaceae bacterium]